MVEAAHLALEVGALGRRPCRRQTKRISMMGQREVIHVGLGPTELVPYCLEVQVARLAVRVGWQILHALRRCQTRVSSALHDRAAGSTSPLMVLSTDITVEVLEPGQLRCLHALGRHTVHRQRVQVLVEAV